MTRCVAGHRWGSANRRRGVLLSRVNLGARDVGGDRRAEVPARVDLAISLGDAGVSLAQYRYPVAEIRAFAAAVYGESRTAAQNADGGGGADTETVTKAAAPGLPEWSGEPDRETTPAEPPQSADDARARLATPDGARPYSFSWRDTRVRAALILLGAAAVVGVVVTAPPRVIAPAATQIFMETTEPEIEPPVPGPSVPTVPPHGYGTIPPPHGGGPSLTPAPDDP